MLALVGLLWLSLSQAGTIEVADDRGQQIFLSAPASRVVSLAPHLTEIVFYVGAGQALRGVMAYSDFPDQAKAIPRIGTHSRIDIEAVVAMQPDLVLGWSDGNSESDLATLKKLGLRVFETNPRTIADVGTLIRNVGKLLGQTELAEYRADEFENDINVLRKEYAARYPVRVFYQIWDKPIYTLGGQHVVTRLIEGCGGINVFADLAALSPVVSREAVLAADPEVIVGPREGEVLPSWVGEWQNWPSLDAVARDQIYTVNADHINRMGPRLVDAMATLCEALQVARDQKS